MNYIFDKPNSIKIDSTKVISFNGGLCSKVNVIYLFGTNDTIDWGSIITHEHLHAILYKNNIPLQVHHSITDELEKALGD